MIYTIFQMGRPKSRVTVNVITRLLDSSHRDSDSSQLESQIWRLVTRLDFEAKDLRLDSDLGDNDSRLDLTWEKMTRTTCRPMFFSLYVFFTWILERSVCVHCAVCGARALAGAGRLCVFFFPVWSGNALIALTMAAASPTAPRVISFAYKNFHSDGKRRSAQCKTCSTIISDKEGTTSNFVRHLKTHDDK